MFELTKAVQSVIPRLIKIGSKLPDEIGRALEEELYPQNLHHLERRREFHHRVHKIRAEQTEKRENFRVLWQQRQAFWKDCRVERAKEEFMLSLYNIEHDNKIDNALDDFKKEQRNILNELKKEMEEWANYAPPHFSEDMIRCQEEERIIPLENKLSELHQNIKQQLKTFEVYILFIFFVYMFILFICLFYLFILFLSF